jgi:hypothetical protein
MRRPAARLAAGSCVRLHFSGWYNGQRALQGVMSEHRWIYARALLRVARVHDGQRITALTAAEFEATVEAACKGASERYRRCYDIACSCGGCCETWCDLLCDLWCANLLKITPLHEWMGVRGWGSRE